MDVALLGPLEVTDGARLIEVTGARLGRLLTRIAVDVGRPVSVTELAAAIWGDDERPADPANSLQSLVSRLRRILGDAGTVQQTAAGYRLSIAQESVDLYRFSALARLGREQLAGNNPHSAFSTLTQALQLWRGTPTYGECVTGMERWHDLRADTTVEQATAALAIGRGAGLLADLEAAAAQYPFREDIVRVQMRILQASGRAPEALTVFEGLRELLAEELGADPGAVTQSVHVEILRGTAAEGVSPARYRLTNLRADVSSFIGRDDDIARIGELLDRSRLVTVLGPGGVGKTRLAGRAGAAVMARYPDGVWMIELASVTEESGIVQAVLSGVGVRDARVVERIGGERIGGEPIGMEPIERLVAALEQAGVLLILDNCEHLINGVALVVDELLARCSRMSVLTTSREPLNIAGEALAIVPPLALPPVGQPARIASSPAVQLFVERAMAVSPGFQLDESTTDDVLRIVRRLDGLPLAIELATARLRVLPLSEIADRLSDRFRLLTGGSRTALPRHRTLRAVVEWSWDLLTPPERLLAERLSVFPSGSTVSSAIAVTADETLSAGEIPDLLSALVDKSLLQMVGGPTSRYRMLETIREFGTEVLNTRGEVESARAAHAGHFVRLAAEAEPVLRTSRQLEALRTINTERDNMLAALRYLTDAGHHAQAIELARSLMWFWLMTGRQTESATVLGRVLEVTTASSHPHRLYLEAAMAMTELDGQMSGEVQSWAQAQQGMRELSDRFDAAPPDDHPLGQVLPSVLAMFAGLPDRGERLVSEALRSDDSWVRGTVRSIRINFLENGGRVDEMRQDIELAYADFEVLGDRWGLSAVLTARARIRAVDGDLAGAVEDYERALACLIELETSDDDMLIMLRLADIKARLGDFDSARTLTRAVIDRAAEQPSNPAWSIFAAATTLMVTLFAEGPESAYRLVDDTRAVLGTAGSGSMIQGHLHALVLAALAYVSLRAGEVQSAHDDLVRAYPVATDTLDLPIVATVGVSIAAYAAAVDRPNDAAQILGAAWTLRGSEDPTDLSVRQISNELRTRMGAEFEVELNKGRGLLGAYAIARLDPGLLPG